MKSLIFIIVLSYLCLSCSKNIGVIKKHEQYWFVGTNGEHTVKGYKGVSLEEVTLFEGPMLGYDQINIKYNSKGCFHFDEINIEINYKTNPPIIKINILESEPETRSLTKSDAQVLNNQINWYRLIKKNGGSTTEEKISIVWLKNNKELHKENYINNNNDYTDDFGTSLEDYFLKD